MAESRLKIVGQITSSPAGVSQISIDEIVNSDAPVGQAEIILSAGDNTIGAVAITPGISIGCVVIFDSTSTTIKKLKGAAGDVGITVSNTKPLVLTWDSPATFIINSSVADTGKRTIIYFF